MFIQVIQGRVKDAEGLRAHWDRRIHQLRRRLEVVPDAGPIEVPISVGWLGTTAGISDEGEFVAVVRFESEALAREDDRRPEQREWRAETGRYFEGPVAVRDSSQVDLLLDGGSDDAGFVQVIQAIAGDVERARTLNSQAEAWLKEHRPEVIGGTVAWHGDGGFTETVYFTTEDAAREGESKALPADARVQLEEWLSLVEGIRIDRPTRSLAVGPRRGPAVGSVAGPEHAAGLLLMGHPSTSGSLWRRTGTAGRQDS